MLIKDKCIKSMCLYILFDILFSISIGNIIKIDLYEISYSCFMKFSLDSILFWLLINTAVTYYGDSLNDLGLSELSKGK